MDENTFTATDQVERELIWDALVVYRDNTADPDNYAALTEMIMRVSQTFAWVRNGTG